MDHRTISISVGGIQVLARLDDNATADKVWEALPISASASTWGDEIYFRTTVQADEQDAVETVDMGAVGLLAPGAGDLPILRPNAGQRGRRDSPSESGQRRRDHRGRPDGAEVGGVR